MLQYICVLYNIRFNYFLIKRDKKLVNLRILSTIFSSMDNSRKQFKCLPAYGFPLLEIFTGSKSYKKNKQATLLGTSHTYTNCCSVASLRKTGYIYYKRIQYIEVITNSRVFRVYTHSRIIIIHSCIQKLYSKLYSNL